MKKSVKRKAEKYNQFILSTNGINYRDKKAVIDQFNKSVREYKRFCDVLSGGDEDLASKKLRDAGTDLYTCCEWALKNYLYKRYDEKLKSGEITKHEREYKVGRLSSRKATIMMLLDELKILASPSVSSNGIDCQKILSNAKEVNNRPKHDRTIPNPSKYKEVLGEIRKIINSYIDSDAKLEFIDDSIYGEGKEWYELLENTSDFNSTYSYVLITKKVGTINLKGLFSLKWDLVIDMDPDSDIDGLAKEYFEIRGVRPRICTLDYTNARKKFVSSPAPYWVMANGTSDKPETVVDPKKWGTAHGKYLTTLLEEYHKEYTKPVKAFIYSIEDEKNLRKIVEAFNDIYDGGEEIDFCLLSADRELNYIDYENFKLSKLKFEEFADNLLVYNQDSQFIESMVKYELPAENRKKVSIDENFATELQDSFEAVYIDVDHEDELDSRKCDRSFFYKGIQNISWYGLREQFDIIQPDKKMIEDKIRQDLKERARLLRKVYYIPGIGGTTMMRRLAWEFRDVYPTLILNRLNEHTSNNLQKIYDLTHMPVLIFADNNEIDIEEVKNLQIDLKLKGFAFVICYFQRKIRGINSNGGSNYTFINEFGASEAKQMKSKLIDFLPNQEAKEEFEKQVLKLNGNDRLPFILAMYAFDKEFKGIKPFIARFIEGMNDQLKKILFALSIADYANVAIDKQYFMDLFYDKSVDKFLLEEAPGINELVRIEKIYEKETIRIRYNLFGEEILRQLSNGRESEEIVFLNLVDYILDFIEDSRSNSYTINQNTLSLLRSLFISRKTDVNSEKPVFSPLITKLREEHRTNTDGKYDPSKDAIVSIFKKLVKVYPEEPHFTAHLARFYFYIDKNYECGFQNINAAIEMSEIENGKVDPLFYHMKAMGYSSRITNMYIRDLLRSLREDPQYDISIYKENIQEDAERAFKYFEIVRDSNIGVAGHVSEINLCIQIANLAKNLLEGIESFEEYISSENGKWAMQYVDRAETVWEELKQLASDSVYEDLDGIEERIKTLTSSVEESIEIWTKYISNSNNRNCAQARRILARSYLKVADSTSDLESKKEYFTKVVSLMEDNISEDKQHVGNIRIWFDAVKRLEVENQDDLMYDAIVKLNQWISITDSADAHYYRFVLKCIQSIMGSTLAESDLPKLLRELKQKSATLYNRTIPRHWLSKNGEGINALVTNNRNKKDAIPEDEMSRILYPLIGRISNSYVNESHAYIDWKGIEVYFNPSATNGEISKINIGQRVKFGIGFSYDGPRAYNSSIKLLGNDEVVEPKREIEPGIIVKCEVIKIVEYFIQVKIVGFSEFGSIHISELVEPFSADIRPNVGSLLEGKVIGKTFDSAKNRYIWRITMNIDNIQDDTKDETEMAKAIRLSGMKVERD